MKNSREQILLATCDLLENQGFHATGLNEIVRESKSPKGSIYYYFPKGKEEIVAEAVKMSGLRVAERIRKSMAEIEDPAAAVQSFVEAIAYHVEASGFRSGGPLTTVASESATTSPRINQVCQEAYAALREAFAEKLRQGGRTEASAESLSWTILSMIEGATILSRTYHSGDPLRMAAAQLGKLIQTCQ
jgi:TetR/AcrR family transcriptional regulator, lmrAB and yxaGH operons repressor